MSGRPCVVHVLDTPNVVRGTARAGTPARVFGLVEHGAHAGAHSVLVLCDRGADYGVAADWVLPSPLTGSQTCCDRITRLTCRSTGHTRHLPKAPERQS